MYGYQGFWMDSQPHNPQLNPHTDMHIAGYSLDRRRAIGNCPAAESQERSIPIPAAGSHDSSETGSPALGRLRFKRLCRLAADAGTSSRCRAAWDVRRSLHGMVPVPTLQLEMRSYQVA